MKKMLVLVFIVSLVLFPGHLFLMTEALAGTGHAEKAKPIALEDNIVIDIGAASFTGFTHSYDFSPEPFIELCLIDPLGRKAGYDYVTGKYFRRITYPISLKSREPLPGEIPDGSYDYEYSVMGHRAQKIIVRKAMPGKYTLQVSSTQAGGYVMSITIRDASGNLWFSQGTNLNLKRIISSGMVHTYSISFNGDDINKLKVTKDVTSGELKTGIQIAFDLTWIDSDGVLNSLIQELENADSALARGQTNSAVNELQAFINEVEAQKGRHINKEAAEILADDARTLINGIK